MFPNALGYNTKLVKNERFLAPMRLFWIPMEGGKISMTTKLISASRSYVGWGREKAVDYMKKRRPRLLYSPEATRKGFLHGPGNIPS